jgi:predicted phage gp36 major capsid-like protein
MGVVNTALQARRIQAEAQREQASTAERRDRQLEAAELQMDAERRSRAGTLTQEQYDAETDRRAEAEFRSYLMTGRSPMGAAYAGQVETRDAGVGTGAAGGFLVPARMADELVRAERFFSAMLATVNVVETDDARPISRPSVDDTATAGAILGENTAITAADIIVVNNTALTAYMYVSPVIKYSWQLDADVAPNRVAGDGAVNATDNGGFDLLAELAWLLGRRLGRKLNLDLTLGTGTAQPFGAFTTGGFTVGVTLPTGNATGLTFKGMRDLIASVDEAYHPGAVFMGNQATKQAVAELVGSNNTPIFDPNSPLTPFGYPFVVNPDVPTMAANALCLGFGNLKRAYTARTTPQSVHVLHERFADTLESGAFAAVRADGRPSGDFGAFKLMANSAT